MATQVTTVLGPIAANDLGITLPHEHLVFDFSCWYEEPPEASRKAITQARVELSNLGEIRRDPLLCRDNCLQFDVDVAIDELLHYKRAGGASLFELTCLGSARDPVALAAIARQTGINVVMGAGYYVAQSHPREMDGRSVEQITEEIVEDLLRGVGGTGIKAGIIGELGTSAPITPNEEKVLRAGGRAHRRTGVPINVHVFPWGREALRVLDVLAEEGVNLNQVAISHANPSLYDLDYQEAVIRRGAYVEYDFFGQEIFTFDSWVLHHPKDTESVAAITRLIERGHLERLLLSQDVYTKTQLTRYGGWGYAHLLRNVEPYFRRAGVSPEQLHLMMVENPKRLFQAA